MRFPLRSPLPSEQQRNTKPGYRVSGGAYYLSLLILTLMVLSGALPPTATAKALQPLDRVTTMERSDGLGYVVRFHMVSRPDSFYIWQPNPKMIQIALYKEGVISENISTGNNHSNAFDNFFYQDIEGGVGVDIYLNEGIYMIADAYMDANGRDLLIGLTEASPNDLEVLTDGLYPIFWDDLMEDVDFTPEIVLNDWEQPDEIPERDLFAVDMVPPEAAFIQLRRIVIDAGHGGRDPGAIGARGTREKNVALSVALKVGEYIERYLPEIEIIYTRKDDTFIPLQERGQIANSAEADLFISIHANANQNRHAHGTEIYFLGMHRSRAAFEVMKKENSAIRFEAENERSEELTPEQLAVYELSNIGFMASSEMLAAKMDNQFANRAMRRSRGVKQAGFIVLYHASMPALLVELGYITNPQEEQFLSSDYGQSIMASAIFRSVRDYKERLERGNNRNNRPD